MAAIENKKQRYNRREIMLSAHEIYSNKKLFKLYQLAEGVQNFADCLRLCWRKAKEKVNKEIARAEFQAKYNEWVKTHVTYENVNLDNVPDSVLYPENNRGYLGSKYVGD